MTNKEKYRELCEREKSIPIFSQYWWMDTVCGEENWDVLLVEKGDGIVCSMPYYFYKKRGRIYITQPVLTPQNGVWIKYPENQKYNQRLSYEKEVINMLIKELESLKLGEYNQNFHYSFTNWLPFYWNSFQQSTRYTYVLENINNMEEVYFNANGKIRNSIKKAQKIVNIKEDLSIEAFYEINKKSFSRQGIKIPYSLEQLKKIDNACIEHNCRKIFYAQDGIEMIHGAVYIVWDENSAYGLMLGEDPDLRNSEAGILLMWTAIQFSAGVSKKFDFEGSMLEPVETLTRKFNSMQKPYFSIRKCYSFSSILNLMVRDMYINSPVLRKFKHKLNHLFRSE